MRYNINRSNNVTTVYHERRRMSMSKNKQDWFYSILKDNISILKYVQENNLQGNIDKKLNSEKYMNYLIDQTELLAYKIVNRPRLFRFSWEKVVNVIIRVVVACGVALAIFIVMIILEYLIGTAILLN